VSRCRRSRPNASARSTCRFRGQRRTMRRAAWIAFHRRSGVAGNSMCSTPNSASASASALAIAAGVLIVPPSPSRRSHPRLLGIPVEMESGYQGQLARDRDSIVGQAGCQQLPRGAVDHLLVEGGGDTLDDRAVNLAVDDHRIDRAPTILGDDVAVQRYLTGLAIDLERHDVRRRGRCPEVGVVDLRDSQLFPRPSAGGPSRNRPLSRSRETSGRGRCRRRKPVRPQLRYPRPALRGGARPPG
jgi:hypothetical protein